MERIIKIKVFFLFTLFDYFIPTTEKYNAV